MGNRAVITTKAKKIGIYLQWNGGRDSVEAFLKYAEIIGSGQISGSGGFARLVQIIGNFLGGTNSLYVGAVCDLDCDNHDNGMYIVGGYEIIGREYFNGDEQCEYDLNDMMDAINDAQPKEYQELYNKNKLGTQFLDAIKNKRYADAAKVYIESKMTRQQLIDAIYDNNFGVNELLDVWSEVKQIAKTKRCKV